MTTPEQRASRRQESRLARQLGGQTVVGSGTSEWAKGDVRAPDVLAEAKTTTKNSYSVSATTWRKIEKEAVMSGRMPVLAIHLAASDLNLIVLSEDDYLELRERAK